MFSYTQSQKCNIYQIVKDHFTFIYNITKKYINILHFIDFYILYKMICIPLKNAKEVKLKI